MGRRRHPVWKVLLVMAADLCAISFGLLFAYWLRFDSRLIEVTKGYIPFNYLTALPWVAGFWLLSLRLENLYRRQSKIFDMSVVRRILTGSTLAVLIFFAFAFYERREPQYSRMLVPIIFGSVVLSLILERLLLHAIMKRLTHAWGVGMTRTLILGGGEIAQRVYETLRENPQHGMAPVGFLTDDPHGADTTYLPRHAVLGSIDDIERVLDQYNIEEVILAQPDLDRDRIPTLLTLCEQHLADFRIVPDTTELLFSGMIVETMNGIPFLGARETPLQGWNAALKRLVDVVLAMAVLVIGFPFFLIVAWLIRREDGGPALYIQERMGLDRRRFRIYKFRSMILGAEEETGPVFADENDPRCTKIGHWLRRYRIDEFPQFINVLKGEMSLVGPRPERPFFVDQFRGGIPRYMARHKVKSGITGWAQIHGLCGKHGTIAQRLRYDLYYVENWSLWLDFKIMFLTFLRAVGAG